MLVSAEREHGDSAPNPWFQVAAGPPSHLSPEGRAADRNGLAASNQTGLTTMIGYPEADKSKPRYQSFQESQRAGLLAAITLAQADAAATFSPPKHPWNRQSSRLSADAVMTSPVLFAPVSTPSTRAVDLPTVSAYPSRNALDGKRATEPADRRRRPRTRHRLVYVRSPLLVVILTIQALFSLRLAWANTAFLDEATYLSVGHFELAHWLHGTPIPPYSTYLSGAPVIYPPIAAMAANLGGLAAARILSLFFMLGATALLWAVTSRLFGGLPALCATTMFAIIGPTMRLGAFATYDPMSLFLLAAAAWCVVAARDSDDSALFLVAGSLLLVIANATKYATMIFDPSVIAIAGLAVWTKRGFKPAVARSGYIAAGVIGLDSGLLAIGGPSYSTGVLSTTLARPGGVDSAKLVLLDSWQWAGLVCAIAFVGVILAAFRRSDRVHVLILAVFAMSGLLAPLNQARIHTIISLSKHVDFGAWFAAVAAGYAISRLFKFGRSRSLHLALAGCLLIGISVPAATMGRDQAVTMFREWPNSTQMIDDLRALTRLHPGNYLVEDYDVPIYYLENSISWRRWSGTWYFSYSPPGATHRLLGLAAYRAAIDNHYFSLVILDLGATPQTDRAIENDMEQSGDYKVIDVVPSSLGQYTIWAYQPPPQQTVSNHGNG